MSFSSHLIELTWDRFDEFGSVNGGTGLWLTINTHAKLMLFIRRKRLRKCHDRSQESGNQGSTPNEDTCQLTDKVPQADGESRWFGLCQFVLDPWEC
jgi:hypothetical protein